MSFSRDMRLGMAVAALEQAAEDLKATRDDPDELPPYGVARLLAAWSEVNEQVCAITGNPPPKRKRRTKTPVAYSGNVVALFPEAHP